ncbi:MAG: hypothetical protein LBJ48_01480, partial [Coriobacteriales bacterium]|nr:hypothetical protein [Coriobacteriales bacterium]
MSALTDLIYTGSNAVAGLAEGAVQDALAAYGEEREIAFPDTAYCFPTIYAAMGVKVQKLGDLPTCVDVLKSLITNRDDLGDALNAGLATAVGAEILEGLKYLKDEPYADEPGIGFVPDKIIRSLGVPLVTGDIPGVAVILGTADNASTVADIVKDYQTKGILTFLVGGVVDQVIDEGVKVGLDYRVIPLGYDITAVIHVVTVAVRAALIFGGLALGDLQGLLAYTKERLPAFVDTFGALDEVAVSAGAGAIALGFPVLADIDLGSLQVPGALESETDHSKTVSRSLALRSIKVKAKELPIPVAFASAFEGDVIRRKDMYFEASSTRDPAFEIVRMCNDAEVEDHSIIIEGPLPEGDGSQQIALAVIVDVAGANMQTDFEPVIERRIHHWYNYMEG